MSTPPPTNRLSLAITTAVASTTLALGVTAAALLGWLAPPDTVAPESPAAEPRPISTPLTEPPPEPAPASVPITEPPIIAAPLEVTFAMHREQDDEHDGEHDDARRYEHGDHDRHEDEDDDSD